MKMPLFLPKLILKNVFEITPELLSEMGIKALILDADNTLRHYKVAGPADGVIQWLETLKDAGIVFMILSNNFASRISPFAKKLDLDYIAMGLKPSPFGILRAKKHLGVTKKQTAVVGDQVFTDIIGGNLLGITTILVEPLKHEDGFTYKIKRTLEKHIIKKYHKKSIDK